MAGGSESVYDIWQRQKLLPGPRYENDKRRDWRLQRWAAHRVKAKHIMYLCLAGIGILIACCAYAYLRHYEAAINRPWRPDAATRHFSSQPLPEPVNGSDIGSYELPLRTRGRDIVDAQGRRFRLASVNWYGASDELFVVGGLDVVHRRSIAQTIRRLGFNSVRMPYADELVVRNPVVDGALVSANSDLEGLRALDVFAAAVRALTDAGLAVIINNHITSATWCCGANPCDAGWANSHLGPLCRVRQTEEQWMDNWERVMGLFVDNPLVIGADLRNEVRGLWGTMPWAKWAAAAERCGNRLLRMRSDWLIVVEGTESANDLSGARERPVELDVPNRLVYSAHVYAWSGWGSFDGRFARRTYQSFMQAMHENWAWLLRDNVAPVWVGEFGAPNMPSVGDAHYWRNLMRFLRRVDADFGYWALNPRKPHANATESYSLLADDWVTPVVDYRLKDMRDLMLGV
ncbi:hypothetical protein CDD82_945 [Ophiocordyceps australis]|uniref:Glycoside hydrolase family 5 domain-containing protein n=1 Tax=Ophiocordyceps australis TaxID=1399860 RepID=A0A2C5YK43_9HYPO|nr:hypothetical protein CDD82_945 [Ophiocordyceps australis]